MPDAQNLTCAHCHRPRFVGRKRHPTTGKWHKFVHPWCRKHKAQRDHAAEILGLPAGYQDYLDRIPKTKVEVKEADVEAWYEKHRHPERGRTAIGGRFFEITCSTTIGVIRLLHCSACGEEASVDDGSF